MHDRYDPDYLFVNGQCRAGWSLVVDPASALIVAAGPREDLQQAYPEATVHAWRGRLIMPGTINAHAHAFQHLARGQGVDRPFLQWRDDTLYRLAPHLDPDTLYQGSQWAFAEMLQAGITTVAEFFYVHGSTLDNDRAVIQAARDVGIRLIFARTFYDWEGAPAAYQETPELAVQRTQTLAAELSQDPTVNLHVAPHSLHGASDLMIQTAYALAQDLGVPCHIHVAEESFEVREVQARTGHTPVAHLAALGVLSPRTLAVHLVAITPEDIAILQDHGARWIYCPASNGFLGDGIPPLADLLAHGIPPALGTDGGCSNNRASIYDEMRTLALLHKGLHQDATVVTHRQVLEFGTKQGAEHLDIPAGDLQPGRLADFVGIDINHPSLIPWTAETLPANMVYAMQPEAIREVVVGGRQVVHEGVLTTVDQQRLGTQVQALVQHWFQ